MGYYVDLCVTDHAKRDKDILHQHRRQDHDLPRWVFAEPRRLSRAAVSPTDRIAALDRALATAGQSVQIQRPGSSTDITSFSATASCRAQVRSGGIGLSEIIVSPT